MKKITLHGIILVAALGLLCFLVSCKDSSDPDQPANYTVSFQSGGGTPIADKTVPKGTDFKLSGYQTELAGHFFDGWYLQGDTAQKLLTSITVTKNITLVAKWLKAVSVTLDLQGGVLAGNPDFTNLRPGTIFEAEWYVPTREDREGFVFLYWYLQDDLFQTEVRSIQVDTDITLVAKWEEGWIVELELDGGEYFTNYLTIAKNAMLELASIRTFKDGYALEGWYYDAAFDSRVPDVIMVTRNITLYVKWVILSYFEPLIGVWKGEDETYLLYIDRLSCMFGFYFSIDETPEVQIHSFTWTDSIIDGKTYSVADDELSLGAGEGVKIFNRVTTKMRPLGNDSLSKLWVKGEGDDIEQLVSLYLFENGSGFIGDKSRDVSISYNAPRFGSSLHLLWQKTDKNGVSLEEDGALLLIIPIVDGKPLGFKEMGDGGGGDGPVPY
jgi:uncharacterized repeat protein (TIGR02543 family)